MPRVARPAQSDRGSSPFESLLEDTSRPAEPLPPQPDNKVSAREDTQASAKSKDAKPAEPRDNAEPVKNDGDGADAVPAEDDTPATTKTAKVQSTADLDEVIKPEGDQEPDNDKKTDSADTAHVTGNDIAVKNSDANAIIAAPGQTTNVTSEDGKQADQSTPPLVAVTDLKPETTPAVPPLPKTVETKKTDDGKEPEGADQSEPNRPINQNEDSFALLTKETSSKHAEDKPQPASSDGDKPQASQSRSDIATNSHDSDASAGNQPGSDMGAAAKVSTDRPTQLQIPTTVSHASQNAAAPATLVSQPGPQAAAVPLSGVAIEIAGKAIAGKNRFEIRLDPPELGRIEVRLDVDRDGNVTSRLTVDRPDTLDLLRRDATGLERALQDAGLKTANNGLQFSLRDQSLNQQQAGPSPGSAVIVARDESLPSVDAIPQQYRIAGQGSGLDIRV
jgi:chemotaxis protein MotD